MSVYALITQGYADTTVHRILSDLMPLIDSRRGRRIIVAGDFNITTQWSAKHRQWRGSFEEARQTLDELIRAVADLMAYVAVLEINKRTAMA